LSIAVAETVDEAATKALRERMREAPRVEGRRQRLNRSAGARDTGAVEPQRYRPRRGRPQLSEPPADPSGRIVATGRPPVANGNGRSLPEALHGLREPTATPGASRSCGTAPMAARLKWSANCAPMARPCAKRGRAAAAGRSLGELLEQAANDSLCKCFETLMRNGH
jgi:hypothetical protein